MNIHHRLIAPLLLFAILLLPAVPLIAGYYESGQNYYVYKKYDKAREMFLKAAETQKNGNAYYFLGEIEKFQANYKAADEYYRLAVQFPINHKYLVNAYWNLVIFAEQRGDYNALIKTCKDMWLHTHDEGARQKIETLINKALWTDNQEAIDSYKEGIRLKDQNRMEDALGKFREALSSDSSFLAAKFELGLWAYRKGKSDEALSYLEEIGTKIPFYAEVHIILGDLCFQRQSYGAAIDHFNKAFDFGFIDKETEYLLLIKRATSYYNTLELEKARDDAEKAVKMQSGSIKPLMLLAAIDIKQQDYDAALETLRKAERLSPENPLILFEIGSIYHNQGDSRAIELFDRVCDLAKKKNERLDKYTKIFIMLAREHFNRKEYARAAEVLEYFPAQDPNYEIMLLRGKTSYHQGEFDRAIELFENLSLQGDDRLLLCRAYARSGRHEKAKQLLAQLITSDEYRQKAKKDTALAPILLEIDRDRVREREEQTPAPAPQQPAPQGTTNGADPGPR